MRTQFLRAYAAPDTVKFLGFGNKISKKLKDKMEPAQDTPRRGKRLIKI